MPKKQQRQKSTNIRDGIFMLLKTHLLREPYLNRLGIH
jgi:hypothetical protein